MLPLLPGPLAVLILAPLPRRRDVDNSLKATIDLCVKLGIIADDCWVDDLRIVRVTGRDDMEISLWLL